MSKKIKQKNQADVVVPAPTQDLELANKLARAMADYANLEKRVAQEKANFIKFANSSFISALLPVLSILEKAAFHSNDAGVKMATAQFKQALLDEGLVEISPKQGDKFDHSLHECIEKIPSEEGVSDTIADVLEVGYKYKEGFVLKPAKVRVYKNND